MTFRGWRVHRARSQLFASLGHIQSKCCLLFWHFDWHARRWAGKSTLACGLETLRPYFLLLHASCSHSSSVLSSCFFCCQLTFTPSPLNIPFGHSSPLLSSPLLSSSHFICAGSLGNALAGGLSCYNPCCSPFTSALLSPSLPVCLPLLTFIALLHHFLCISLSKLNSFSMLHIFLCPPYAHLHSNFAIALV